MRMMKDVNKRVLAIGLAVVLLATSLCSLGVSAAELQPLGARVQELQVAVLSEPRIFPQSLISHGAAFNEAVRSDIAMLSESQAILDAAIEEIIQQAPDVLLVPGNLTREGEVAAHEHLAGRLNYLRTVLPDINIYVINGSRDFNNPNARSFAGGAAVSIGSASPELFRSIYSGLGYNEATSIYFVPVTGQGGGNSYVARPAPGFTVIAIDTADGAIGAELLAWITEQTQVANSRGDTIFAFMHHSLVPHSSIQDTMFSETLIADHEYISARFSELGIRYIFTGAMRANNIAQVTNYGNILTDISTASLTAYPAPLRFASFTRGVNAENRRTETVEISTRLLQSINYIDIRTGQNISDLTEYSSRMITPDVVVSLILDSGIYDMLHEILDEMEATEFVNTRGVRHTGLRAFIESNLPVEDEYGNPISNDFGDVFIELLEEILPTSEAEGMDLGGIGILWVESHQNRLRVRLLGGFAGNVFMTYNNIRNHLINPGLAQLNNNLLLDRRIVNETIDQLGHDLLSMNVYPLPVADGEGGYFSAGNQHTLFDLVRHAYLSHLAGDEQPEQWMLDVIEHLNEGGQLVNAMVDLILENLGVALDNVLHTVTINTGALVTSDLLGTLGRVAVVAFLGNNLGSIMSGFGFSAVELIGDLGEMFSEEEVIEMAEMLTDTFLALLLNYGYPNDNFTTLHWVGGEVEIDIPVDRIFLRAAILEAEDLHHEEFTPESWANFAVALDAAKEVYEDVDATQGQVDEALSSLQVAISNLELVVIIIPVDRTVLRALIAEAVGLKQADYTPETWSVLAGALSVAHVIYDNEGATQGQVDEAVNSLQAAINSLEEAVIIIPVDRAALRALIAQANQLNQADYTPESWQGYATALSAARGVYDNVDATQAQVDQAWQNLNTATLALVRIQVHVPAGFTEIRTEDQLRAMTRRGHYWLANDIVLIRRWTPIARFEGTLDGNGNTIRNLEISGRTDQGLFRRLDSGATIRNLGIQVGPAGVHGSTRVGALAGRADRATISGVRIQLGHDGVVGSRDVGGLIGRVSRSVIMGSLVYGQSGLNEVHAEHPEPNNVIAVRGNNRIRSNAGGLVGELDRSTVSRSASYVNVTGYTHVGGFVGSLRSSGISNSFARGYVRGRTVYLRFTHSRGERIGGFIGVNLGAGSWIESVYSSGVVESNGRRRINPFIGQANNVLLVSSVSFYNRDAAAISTVNVQDLHNIRIYGEAAVRSGLIGESRASLMSRETFTTQGAHWNFYNIWTVGLRQGTPFYTPTLPHFIMGVGLQQIDEIDFTIQIERPIELFAQIDIEDLDNNVVRYSISIYNFGSEEERTDRLQLFNILPVGADFVPNSVHLVTENANGDEVRTTLARNTSGISLRGHNFNPVTRNLEIRLGDYRLHGDEMVVIEFEVTVDSSVIDTDASATTTVAAGRVSRTSPDNITMVTVESEGFITR